MARITPEYLKLLLSETKIFIKVFGSNNMSGGKNEFFKIPSWLEEICHPQTQRHSKLSVLVNQNSTDYHDKRFFATKKDASTRFKLQRPQSVSWFNPTLQKETQIHADPPMPGEDDTEAARIERAKEFRSEWEQVAYVEQVKVNPLDFKVSVKMVRAIRGMPRAEVEFAKKQPMTLLPAHLKTEFYHRTRLGLPTTFHIGFLFNKNECDLKGEQYFFPFDAWTWAQWWILPDSFKRWNNQVIPVQYRSFLPSFERPEFLQEAMNRILKPVDRTTERLTKIAEDLSTSDPELPSFDLPPSPRFATPRKPSSLPTQWDPAIPLVAEHIEGAKENQSTAFSHASNEADELRRHFATNVPPTSMVTPPQKSRSRIASHFHEGRGYHLIFKSLGYEGLKKLINDIPDYSAYFLNTFLNTAQAGDHCAAGNVNTLVQNISHRMVQLNRLLLHNEVLIAPKPQSIVGICLIPSKPLPRNFNLKDFYNHNPAFSAPFETMQEAKKHQAEVQRSIGNEIPIFLLDTYLGVPTLLDSHESLEPTFLDINPPGPIQEVSKFSTIKAAPSQTARATHGPKLSPRCGRCRDLQRQFRNPHALCIYHRTRK